MPGIKDTIHITIDQGQQPDMLTGQVAEVEIKRECNLIKPTLWDYARENEVISKIKGDI
jgi:hypothetical protein